MVKFHGGRVLVPFDTLHRSHSMTVLRSPPQYFPVEMSNEIINYIYTGSKPFSLEHQYGPSLLLV